MKKVCVVGGRNPDSIAFVALILAELTLVPDMDGIVTLTKNPLSNLPWNIVPDIPVAQGPVNVGVVAV